MLAVLWLTRISTPLNAGIANEILSEENLVAERILLLLASAVGCESKIRALDTGVTCCFRPPVESASLGFAQVGTDLVGRDELLVFVNDGSSET